MTTVVLVRHGETGWNRESRLQGWAPVSLNERGQKQALAATASLDDTYDVDRIVSSDLVRTRETTETIRSAIDVPVRYDGAWRERDLGVYQGLTLGAVTERFPEFGLGEPAARAAEKVPDSGESLVQVAERVVAGWNDLLAASDAGETILVVTHGGPIRLLLGHLEDVAIADALLARAPANCSLTEIECSDTPEIVRENATPWA